MVTGFEQAEKERKKETEMVTGIKRNRGKETKKETEMVTGLEKNRGKER